MKKIYEAPAIEMLIVEPVVLNDLSGPNVVSEDPDGISNNDDVLSREFDSWDE